jgi:hypothetical protein
MSKETTEWSTTVDTLEGANAIDIVSLGRSRRHIA